MALSGFNLLKGNFNLAQTFGSDAVNSDATLTIDGYENFFVKIKSFPDPESGVEQTIEIPLPLGGKTLKAGQIKTFFTGPISFLETETREVGRMLAEINENGGYFDCWLYHGTPDHYVNRKRLVKCCITLASDVARDMTSNAEVLLIEGELNGNYFGEIEEGNVKTLMGAK